MSTGTLSQVWTQNQNASSVQAPGGARKHHHGTGGGDADWMANLANATSTAAGTPGTTSTGATDATMSDQMQALLVQMQAGNTTAPAAPATATASADPTQASSATASSAVPAHHGHHHHGAGSSALEDENDIATDVSGELEGDGAASAGTSSAASGFAGLQQAAGTMMGNVQDLLKTYGAAAVQGAATGAVMAAI